MLNQKQKVLIRYVNNEFIWNSGEIIWPEKFKEAKDRVNEGLPLMAPMGLNKECNFSHMACGFDSLEKFATTVFFTTNGLTNEIKGDDEFIHWYEENKKPYQPIDWLNSCYGMEEE